ncbi:MAG TPA: membrane dipeptidase [Steroidobacteraceae bacterium]|jgi:membrane dipeptidase|nr:membrane dipeptidase [Steroidobacteraceae bacterium]
MINRRQLIGGAAAAAIVQGWSGARAATNAARTATTAAYPRARYHQAVVIDALGGLGEFNPDAPDDAPLSARGLSDARESGVTVVNFTVNDVGNGPNKFMAAVKNIADLERELALHPDALMKVVRGRDIQTAKASKRVGIVYGCQDTTMLEADLKNLRVFANLGVRIVQPTYNIRNLMGDGCIENADGGLSKMGYDFVAEMNQLNLLLDLSHAGPRTIAEGIAASKAPMAITHTGCRALVDLPRNTRDSELKALADRGGVAGIYFMPFLRESGQPHAADLIRHIEHAVNVCGEDHVGLGTDGSISGVPMTEAYLAYFKKEAQARAKAGFAAPGESADVLTIVPEYNDPLRFYRLANDLKAKGWPDSRIEKLLGANFEGLFAQVWDAA